MNYLSPRERTVLTCKARGMTNKEIGSSLGISESTVKHHVRMTIAKLGADGYRIAVYRDGQNYVKQSKQQDTQ